MKLIKKDYCCDRIATLKFERERAKIIEYGFNMKLILLTLDNIDVSNITISHMLSFKILGFQNLEGTYLDG